MIGSLMINSLRNRCWVLQLQWKNFDNRQHFLKLWSRIKCSVFDSGGNSLYYSDTQRLYHNLDTELGVARWWTEPQPPPPPLLLLLPLLLAYYYYYYYYYFRCSAFCLTSHFPTTESDCLLLSYISNELQLHDFCCFRWGTFCVSGIFVFNK